MRSYNTQFRGSSCSVIGNVASITNITNITNITSVTNVTNVASVTGAASTMGRRHHGRTADKRQMEQSKPLKLERFCMSCGLAGHDSIRRMSRGEFVVESGRMLRHIARGLASDVSSLGAGVANGAAECASGLARATGRIINGICSLFE